MNRTKEFLAEFKKFISRGNVVDLAVGVVVGGAFTSIVNSLVKDIIMPICGLLFGGIDFTTLRYVITPASADVPEAAIYYGNFIQNIVNFILISFVIFCAIKTLNHFHKKAEEAKPAPVPSEEVKLLMEIRDVLQNKKQLHNESNNSDH